MIHKRPGTWPSVILGSLLLCALLLTQAHTALAQQQHFIPMLPPASTSSHQGFVRFINHSDREGRIRILAIDDTGRRFGPVFLSVDAKETAHFTSRDLERGNVSKGLSGGVGNGQGNWRLELETSLDIEPLAYVRTADGFLTSVHDLAREAGSCHHVPIFNPGSNLGARSQLRLFNPGSRNAEVTIKGRDDRGDPPPAGDIRLTVPAGASRTITAQQLESGANHFSGRFGNGRGKWQLFVSADQPVRVVSLLSSPATGHLTNLSTSPFRTSASASCGDGGGVGSGDLRVESVSVSDNPLTVGQSFTLYATVHNPGADTSRPTTVTAYWSFLPGASAPRTRMKSSSVPALSPRARRRVSISGLSAGLLPGNFYFSACVENPSSAEHCSDAIRVTVGGATTPPPQTRGVSMGIKDGCNDGYRIDYRFFGKDSGGTTRRIFPARDKVYYTLGYGQEQRHDLGCADEVVKICYGAKTGSKVWGVGLDGDRGCQDCCGGCPSSGVTTYRTVRLTCPN